MTHSIERTRTTMQAIALIEQQHKQSLSMRPVTQFHLFHNHLLILYDITWNDAKRPSNQQHSTALCVQPNTGNHQFSVASLKMTLSVLQTSDVVQQFVFNPTSCNASAFLFCMASLRTTLNAKFDCVQSSKPSFCSTGVVQNAGNSKNVNQVLSFCVFNLVLHHSE